MVGAVEKLGIDLGHSRSTLSFSQDLKDRMRAVDGKEARSETHGLMTYEQDAVSIIGIDAHTAVTVDPLTFNGHLTRWMDSASQLSDRQRLCSALINDSWFTSSAEAQFILCVSAVEALCDQAIHDQEYPG